MSLFCGKTGDKQNKKDKGTTAGYQKKCQGNSKTKSLKKKK